MTRGRGPNSLWGPWLPLNYNGRRKNLRGERKQKGRKSELSKSEIRRQKGSQGLKSLTSKDANSQTHWNSGW